MALISILRVLGARAAYFGKPAIGQTSRRIRDCMERRRAGIHEVDKLARSFRRGGMHHSSEDERGPNGE